MGFTRSTADVKVHQSMADYPRVEDGMSAEELKKKFDAPAEQLQKDLNKLVDELEAETGANSTGAQQLTPGDTTAPNVQAKLLYLLEQIQNAILNQIPDGSITETKLNPEYASLLAKTNGTLQEGLNAEKINGKTDSELYGYMIKMGEYTGNSVESQTIELGFKPSAVYVSSTLKRYFEDGDGASRDDSGLITSDGLSVTYTYAGGSYSGNNTLTDTGFVVNKLKSSSGKLNEYYGLNETNRKYHYIAFR